MKIKTQNEWGTLKSIVVGSAAGANKPEECHFEKTGAFDGYVCANADQDLERLVRVLEKERVKVYRPKANNFLLTKGMYNYSPRDRLLIVDETVVDCHMQYDCRQQESKYLDFVLSNAKKVVEVPRQDDIRFDAANVCRVGKTLLYLISPSGTSAGAEWLRDAFPEYTVETTQTYTGVHIDSTFIPVHEGLVVINKDRVSKEQVPNCFKHWNIIWVGNENLYAKNYTGHAIASNYIQLNFLMINPKLAVTDNVPYLQNELAKYGVQTYTVPLSQSRTLGGGHHCVTLDLHRK